MARTVLILGFEGVLALDMVGPFDVFTGASLCASAHGAAGYDRPRRVPAPARRAAMTPRHFTRVFTEEVGEAPGAYVERIRTEVARRQLTETDDPVTVIAARCGYGSSETLRRNFVRRPGVSPDGYRETFA